MSLKVALNIVNVVFTIFGLIIACGSIGFFVYINMFASLRNGNHYLLDFRVYWPQAVPWMFFVASLFVIFSSCCGFRGTSKRSKSLVTTYGVFAGIASAFLLLCSILALAFADGPYTDEFIADAVWDGYSLLKDHPELEKTFGNIEKRLYCCGAVSPRDYVSWKKEFPQSCCDVIRYGFLDDYPIDCSTSNKLANERHGCAEVAGQYARIGIKALSGFSIFTAMLGIFVVVVSVFASKQIKNRRQPVIDRHELESKKVLL